MSTRAQVPLPTPKVVKEVAGVPITSMHDSFAADFPDLAAGMKNFVTNLVNGQSAGRQRTTQSNSIESRRLEKGAQELFEQTQAQGWQVTMVINMNPWPIKVNGVLHDEVLPACPSLAEWRQSGRSGKPYAHVLLDMWAQDVRDKGDGIWTHHPFMPMQLAKDYINECAITKWGGVFFYPGNYLPDDPNMPSDLRTRVEIEWAAAEKKMITWARGVFSISETIMNRPGADRSQVRDTERRAAVLLHDRGFLPGGLPRWVTETAQEAAQQKQCPSCFNKVDQQAILCGNGRCTFVFDPRKAYTDGLIDDTHPSLRRLTREELDSLELQHVKSIAHLAGVVKAAPVVSAPADDPAEKFSKGEELTDEELEKLTKPSEPEAPKPQTKAEKKKSEQQKKAEQSLE